MTTSINGNGSTLYGTLWDERVTICVDARRIRYCAQQIIKSCRGDAEIASFAQAMLVMSHDPTQITYQQRHILESYYRAMILMQKTPVTVFYER